MNQTEETRALDELADRLGDRFPDTPPEGIKMLVAEVHHHYDGRPIREFIPVLVEREVAERLRARVPSARAS